MKKLSILITLVFWAILCYSQGTFLQTYHTKTDLEYIGDTWGLLKCKNGNQIFTSTYEVTVGSQIEYVLVITRIDSSGDIVWNASLQEQYYAAAKIFEDLEGNLYFFTANYIYACVVKISAMGQVIWSKHYGEYSGFFDAVMLNTGEIVAIGGVFSQSGLKNDSYMVKIDQDGEILWEKSTNFEDGGYAQSIIKTEDGGMIIGGSREGDVKFPGGSIYFAKIDSNGNLVWIKSLGYFNTFICKILKTGSDNYTIVSNGLRTGQIYRILLTNIDEAGNINWSKYLPNSNGGQYQVFDAFMKNDKLIMTGIYLDSVQYRIILFNTSLTGKINLLSIFPPSLSHMLNIQANADNGFLLSGFFEEVVNTAIEFPAVMKTDSLGQIPCLTEIDYNPPLQVIDYPVTVDSGGTLISLNNAAVLDTPLIRTDITFTKKVICESNATTEPVHTNSPVFTFYPNPASSEVSIELNEQNIAPGTDLQIVISDAMGRKLYSGVVDRHSSVTLPAGTLPPGYYVVSMVSDGRMMQSQKLVVVD